MVISQLERNGVGRKTGVRVKYSPPCVLPVFADTTEPRFEEQRVERVPVRVFNIAKTISHLFRYRQTVGINVALKDLREALRQQQATPAEIARYAVKGGVWKVIEPYMMALTSNKPVRGNGASVGARRWRGL